MLAPRLAIDALKFTANVFGDDDTEVMNSVEVREGEIAELPFYLIVRKHGGGEEPEEE